MRLISCYVEGFGNLSGKQYKFDNLTVFLRENGAGKTTLAAFIKAMFYGLPSVRTGGSFNERQRFCPFGGNKFGGNLVFEKGGKTYRIERFFDKKSETRDELTLYCGGKRVPAGDLGRETFGLDAASFARTAFINSEICEGAFDGDVNRALNRDAGATDPADFGAALSVLDSKRKELKADRGKKGLLYDKKEERARLSSEIEQLKERERELGARYGERTRLCGEISALERAKDRQNEGKILSAKMSVLEGFNRELSQSEGELKKLRDEYPKGLPSDGELDFAAEKQTELVRLTALAEGAAKSKGKARYALAAAAALLVACGAWLCTVTLAGIAVIALGLAATAGFAFLCVKGKRASADGFDGDIRRVYDEIYSVFDGYGLAKPQDITGAIKHLRQERQRFDALCADCRSLSERIASYAKEQGLDAASPLETGVENVGEELEIRRRRLGLLDGAIAAEEAELELLPDKLSRLESLDEELCTLTQKYETLVQTSEFLKEADRAIKDRVVAPVRGRFGYYAGEIEAALGRNMNMNADFSVSIEKNGSQMGERHLSAGQRSVVNLCLRLALIDNMYGGEKPFLVMDDPFVNLDCRSFEGCRRVVRALSEKIQIIYFTCHESRKV